MMAKERRWPKPYSRGLVSGREILQGTRDMHRPVASGTGPLFVNVLTLL